MKVFTVEYRPFVCGGNVYRDVYTDVPEESVNGPHDIGRGYQGYVITAPNKKTFVAEANSGAFVGPDLKTVKNDIETGDPELMKEQVADATKRIKTAEFVPLEKFWKKLKCL